jgi:formylglycine-generating enzyme
MIDPSLQFARVPAGEFFMGAEDGEFDERPQHKTYVDEFYISSCPITNGDYAQFIRETGHPSPAIRALPMIVSGALETEFRRLAEKYFWMNGTPPAGGERHPVTLVGFQDALDYCGWLAGSTGKPIRLPTEAEWEKAARGGLEAKAYPWGNAFETARAHLLLGGTSKSDGGTCEVGSYPPNSFGLFDMAGNVWEWVSDWYAPNYYSWAQYLNPQGPDNGLMRIVRGGAWVNDATSYLRCAYRHKLPPDSYSYSIGFRIAYSTR